MSELTDALAVRMRELDPSAVEEFSRSFGPRLRRYFLKSGLPQADAEELSYTCITKVWMQIERFAPDGPNAFDRWVFRLARNLRADEYRRRRRSPSLGFDDERAPVVDEDWDTEDRSGSTELVVRVRDAVASLEPKDRELINLRYLQSQERFAEIGLKLGMTEEAARVRCHRALGKLRDKLKDLQPLAEGLA